MAQIQMTDFNPSGSELIEELTDEELLAINGGVQGPIGDIVRSLGFSSLADIIDIMEEVAEIALAIHRS